MLKKKYRVQWSVVGRNNWNILKDYNSHSEAMLGIGEDSKTSRAEWKIEEIFVKEQPSDLL